MKALRYDIGLMARDMDASGLLQKDLVERSKGGLTATRVSLFLRGLSQSRRTALEMARALGQPLERYVPPTRKGRAA
jgi:hypothetical protein